MTQDPLAHMRMEPDVSALQEEFQRMLLQSPNDPTVSVSRAENTRYNRRPGKSDDGLLHQKNLPQGVQVRPYDHKPDCDIPLADETINAQVNLDCVSFWNSRVKPAATHANRLTSAQVAELRALVQWMIDGPLQADLIDGVEYLSQCKNTVGWCVLHPCWRTRNSLRKQTLTLEQFELIAGQAPPGSVLSQLPAIILDETMEPRAVELIREVYPHLKKNTATRIVRELRTQRTTEFVYADQVENRPCIEVLVPGVDVFIPEETKDIQETRAIVRRDYYSQVELEAKVMDEGWDEEFVSQAVATSGQTSEGKAVTNVFDPNGRLIEILTAYVKQTDEDGVPGIYCTVFSNFVGGPTTGRDVNPEAGSYGKHYLLDVAHGQYPFLLQRTEVVGPRPSDSRGIPEILRTDQFAAKRMQDGLLINSELSNTPPIKRIGGSSSKIQGEITPGGIMYSANGANFEPLDLTKSSKPDLALKLMELIYQRRNDYFDLPSTETTSHPSRWQSGQARKTSRWLMVWGQALWQLAVLCYQTYSPEELGLILGRRPLLTTGVLLKQLITLKYDVRTLDTEWVIELAKTINQFVVTLDRSGVIDMAKYVRLIMSALDPTFTEEVTVDDQGAAQAVLNQVRQEVAWIMQGNEGSYTQNDASAGQKLQFLKQIIANNPEYQMQLMPMLQTQAGPQQNPHFNGLKFERMKKYEANLQHSFQEMVISPQQGRLGVTPGGMEQGPPQVLPEMKGQ